MDVSKLAALTALMAIGGLLPAGAEAPASGPAGLTLRVVLPGSLLTFVKAVRIAGTYNEWAVPQPMVDKGGGTFEYSIVNPLLEGKTLEYRLYPGGSSGWDGAEGPDPFKRTFVYSAGALIVLKDIVFGKNGKESTAAGESPIDIHVDSERMFQTMDGFGAALTDASAAWGLPRLSTPRDSSPPTNLSVMRSIL